MILNFLSRKKDSLNNEDNNYLIKKYSDFLNNHYHLARLAYRLKYHTERIIELINNINESQLNDKIVQTFKDNINKIINSLLKDLDLEKRTIENLKNLNSNFVKVILPSYIKFINNLKELKQNDITPENLAKLKEELMVYRAEFQKIIDKYKENKEKIKEFLTYLGKSLKEAA
jgi:DNA-directed RNA polymerase beta' subunit